MRRLLALSSLALMLCLVAGAQAHGASGPGAGATPSSTSGTADGSSSGAARSASHPDERLLRRWRPGVKRAKRYARRRAGDVRFAIIEPEGRMHRYRAARRAPAASVFKAMLLATYLRQREVRDRKLRRRDKGLLGPMIRRSDNQSATRVRDIVGRSAIERLARDARMRRFRYHSTWGLSRTAAGDQARFFFRYEEVIPRRHEPYARRLLSSITPSQRWGVGQARPAGWELFFKGGWGVGSGAVNHQVAWVERFGHRVSLAIFTEYSPSHGYGKRTLEGVAKRLLRELPKIGRGGGDWEAAQRGAQAELGST